MVLPCVAIAGAVAFAVALPLAGLGYRFQWSGPARPRRGEVDDVRGGRRPARGLVGPLVSLPARNGRSTLLSVAALVVAGAVLVVPIGWCARPGRRRPSTTSHRHRKPARVRRRPRLRPGATTPPTMRDPPSPGRSAARTPTSRPPTWRSRRTTCSARRSAATASAGSRRRRTRRGPARGHRHVTIGRASRTTSWSVSDRPTEAAGWTCARCRRSASARPRRQRQARPRLPRRASLARGS